MSATASHLSTILQGSNGNSSQLSRHVSSVGEHFSHSYTTPPVPKRAETFAGFDSQFDVPKGKVKIILVLLFAPNHHILFVSD